MAVHLPQPLKCQDCRHVPPRLTRSLSLCAGRSSLYSKPAFAFDSSFARDCFGAKRIPLSVSYGKQGISDIPSVFILYPGGCEGESGNGSALSALVLACMCLALHKGPCEWRKYVKV